LVQNSKRETKKESEAGVATHFELNDGLFVKARVKQINSVCLWLGANVMVEYSFEEAVDLLTKKLRRS